MSAFYPVQVAAVQRWKGYAPLMALVTGIHDGTAPAKSQMPYITVDGGTEVPRGALGAAGWTNTLTAHVWSRQEGNKEGALIVKEMHAALAEALAVEGHQAARLKPDLTTPLRDPSGARHFVVRYRILTFEAP